MTRLTSCSLPPRLPSWVPVVLAAAVVCVVAASAAAHDTIGGDKTRLGLSENTDVTDVISNFDIRDNGCRAATGVNWQRICGTRAARTSLRIGDLSDRRLDR